MLVRGRENTDSRNPEGVFGKVEEALFMWGRGYGASACAGHQAWYKWDGLSLPLVPG